MRASCITGYFSYAKQACNGRVSAHMCYKRYSTIVIVVKIFLNLKNFYFAMIDFKEFVTRVYRDIRVRRRWDVNSDIRIFERRPGRVSNCVDAITTFLIEASERKSQYPDLPDQP